MATATTKARGGAWLLEEAVPANVFTPERLSEEHRLMAQTTDQFVEREVEPNLDALETKDWNLARALLRRCGELGLLGVDVPEAAAWVALARTLMNLDEFVTRE